MFFDFATTSEGLIPAVRFSSHSVVEQADGTLIDITPSQARQRYPFIKHHGDEDDFVNLVDGWKVVNLDYGFT
jgi:hypothetical protein